MGIGPIPYHHIRAYGADYGLEGEMLHDFVQIEILLDGAYLKVQRQKLDEQTKGGGK